MVRTAEQQDGDAVLRLHRLEDGAPLGLEIDLEDRERLPRFAASVIVLVLGHPQAGTEHVEQAPRHERRLDERQRRVEVFDAAGGEEVDLLGEGGLHDLRRAGDDGAARVVHRVGHEVVHVREDGEENVVERAASPVCCVEQQVVDVRLRRPWTGSRGRSTRICRRLHPNFLGGLVAPDDVLSSGMTDRFEVRRGNQGRGGVHVHRTRGIPIRVATKRVLRLTRATLRLEGAGHFHSA